MDAPVVDPFDLARDPALPRAAAALDPATAAAHLRAALLPRLGTGRELHLRSIRVVRHKPGRRCLIEYGLEVLGGGRGERTAVLGKMRARGLDHASHGVQAALWEGGFAEASERGVSVPEPLGVVPALEMWLQRSVPGVVATRLLPEPGGARLAARMVEAIHAVHRAGLPARRRHTLRDELKILHERLPRVAAVFPRWERRLAWLLARCDLLGEGIPAPVTCGIHRDFYSDQVIVEGERLHLLDFDLFCEGDPALDVGNLLGHIAELSLRTHGDPHALADLGRAAEQRYLELAGEERAEAVHAYTTLTLARHIHISTLFPERRPWTERLLELCEERLSTPARSARIPRPPAITHAQESACQPSAG